MNDEQRTELARIRERQEQLERELRLLGRELGALQAGLAATSTAVPPVPAAVPQRDVSEQRPGLEAGTPARPSIRLHTPAPSAVPPVITSTEPRSAPPPVLPPAAPAASGSLELRLGTYWLVRIGVVMLLTAAVFFANYAYQNFIANLGPAGKVGWLYAAGALLLGAGAWLQRRSGPAALQNYGQVLFAAGLAEVYFTTFAAHHLEPLRIIPSAALDGALLLAWAGFMAFLADRKKSERLAFLSVGLAYYTSVMTPAGAFTLVSNLVLALAAVFFLVRQRWASLSLASVAATYFAYAFWRFHAGGGWRWTFPERELWFGASFLIAYWVVFTAGVFLCRNQAFTGAGRAAFLTLNNGAFYGLFLLVLAPAGQGGFWRFSLLFGGALLALAPAAARALAPDRTAAGAYLTQGLVAVTLGLMLKFAGFQLALLLAAESLALLVIGQRRRNPILRGGAYTAAGLSLLWGVDGLRPADPRGLYAGLALGGLLLGGAALAHFYERGQQSKFRPPPAAFTLLALAAWLITLWNYCPQTILPAALAGAGAAVVWLGRALRAREIPLLGQGLLWLGQGGALWNLTLPAARAASPLWAAPVVMLLSLVAPGWGRRGALEPGWARAHRWTALALSIGWVCARAPERERLWLLGFLGAGFFVGAGWHRSLPWLAASAAYSAAALTLFWVPSWPEPKVYWPNLAVIVLFLAQQQAARRSPGRYAVPERAHASAISAGGLSLWLFVSRWVMAAGTGFYLTASWAALALAFFVAGVGLRERTYRWLGLGVLALALGRVGFLDVWKLETGYRILSFLALGLVLLVLGFIYNRWQEKIRRWL